MLAEGRITVLKTTIILDRKIEIIDLICEGLLIEVDEKGTGRWVELLKTEGVQYNLHCFLHFILFNDIKGP